MTPSYKTHDPRGWCGDPSRGAALGRTTYGAGKVPEGRLTLRRIRLDSGGYDRNGTYFGNDLPLYWYAGIDTDGDDIDGMLRAYDRDDAKERVRKLFPTATFYR